MEHDSLNPNVGPLIKRQQYSVSQWYVKLTILPTVDDQKPAEFRIRLAC